MRGSYKVQAYMSLLKRFFLFISPSNWVDDDVPGPVQVLPYQDGPHAPIGIGNFDTIRAWMTKDTTQWLKIQEHTLLCRWMCTRNMIWYRNMWKEAIYQHQSSRACWLPSQSPDLLGSPDWCPPPPGKTRTTNSLNSLISFCTQS